MISLRAQDPEERNRDAKIRTLERGRPRVTQRCRAPSLELPKQTRDQGCGSLASLPLSPSLAPTLEFSAPAVPPPHTQIGIPLALEVCALGLELSLLLEAAGSVYVSVCARTHARAHACAHATIYMLFWAGSSFAHSPPPSPPPPHTHTHTHTVHIFTGPHHTHLYTHARLTETWKHALDLPLSNTSAHGAGRFTMHTANYQVSPS